MSYETVFAKAMKNSKTISALSLTIVGLLLGSTVAKADSLSVSIDPSVLSIPISELGDGQTFIDIPVTATYEGSMSLEIYGGIVGNDVDLGPGISYESIPFEFGGLILSSGESFTEDLVLDLSNVPGNPPASNVQVGSYGAALEVDGVVLEPDGTPTFPPDDIYGGGDFTLNITPEPSSVLLLGSGLAGLLGMIVWRARASEPRGFVSASDGF